ncbi:MAG: zf-HC2 domain-containing protein [Planctomycetota bacterium]
MPVLRKIKFILTLNCETSTRIMSDGLDRELSRTERYGVRLHSFICHSCRQFGKQLIIINDAVRAQGTAKSSSDSLTPEARQKMIDALRNADS